MPTDAPTPHTPRERISVPEKCKQNTKGYYRETGKLTIGVTIYQLYRLTARDARDHQLHVFNRAARHRSLAAATERAQRRMTQTESLTREDAMCKETRSQWNRDEPWETDTFVIRLTHQCTKNVITAYVGGRTSASDISRGKRHDVDGTYGKSYRDRHRPVGNKCGCD